MFAKPGHNSQLQDRTDRTIARLAAIARFDTLYGGSRAMVLACRMEDINPSGDYRCVVDDVYSRSTGQRSTVFEAWECPECGSQCLGIEAAMNCCVVGEDDE
jgi:rubrerythrin